MHTVGDEHLGAVEHPFVALTLRLVRMPATSEPAPGSVMPTAVISSPAITFFRYFSFCAGVPAWCRCGLAMSVWTSTVMMKPA
jgi:hypothetical protein